MTSPSFYVRQHRRRGQVFFVVDLPPSITGRNRLRRSFEDHAAACAFAKSFLTDRGALGSDFAGILHRMPTLERVRLAIALERLRVLGWTLDAAVDFIEEHGRAPSCISLADLARRFLEEREAKGCRPRHLGKVRAILRRFCAGRGEQPASAIGPEQVREFVNRNGWGAQTRRSYLIDLKALFNFGTKHGLLRENPAGPIPLPILDDTEPNVLPVDSVRRVMDACQRSDPALLPFAAMLFFSGLRTAEALRITGEDLRPGFIEVKGRKAKTRQRRLIPRTPQLDAWLEAGFALGGTLPPRNWQRRWKDLRKAAGLFKEWPQNASRHSFVSYHYALHGSARETASVAGHSEQMLFQHYRGLATPADAAAYFAIMPDPAALDEGRRTPRSHSWVNPSQAMEACRSRWSRAKGSDPLAPPTPPLESQSLAKIGGGDTVHETWPPSPTT